ncbi:hypothetical protein [sulfur-oxidizing endosymbiont of Gigantopelta aegis]|uniref:hypothetical protein n=1 Tax=sulfur-oxidizing endosymbiont of Gigantopelta aegis TaxID=2794934 RepID=UPI0018DBB7BF|nr:hypothetical protein [sulfur-oxidizing endosymbiont of Gigantopelta aegis]
MKAMLSTITIFLLVLPALSFANDQVDIATTSEIQDYCYKPSKPLFFATNEYKRIYAEDVSEYKRCRQGYIEMKQRVALMKAEADKNAKLIHKRFINSHH